MLEDRSTYVSDTLDHSARNHVNGWNDESQENSIDWQSSVEDLSHCDGHGHNNCNDGNPPPDGHLPVWFHQPSMNVQLGGSFESPHELVPVEEIHVRKNASDGGEGETVNLLDVVSKDCDQAVMIETISKSMF